MEVGDDDDDVKEKRHARYENENNNNNNNSENETYRNNISEEYDSRFTDLNEDASGDENETVHDLTADDFFSSIGNVEGPEWRGAV